MISVPKVMAAPRSPLLPGGGRLWLFFPFDTSRKSPTALFDASARRQDKSRSGFLGTSLLLSSRKSKCARYVGKRKIKKIKKQKTKQKSTAKFLESKVGTLERRRCERLKTLVKTCTRVRKLRETKTKLGRGSGSRAVSFPNLA